MRIRVRTPSGQHLSGRLAVSGASKLEYHVALWRPGALCELGRDEINLVSRPSGLRFLSKSAASLCIYIRSDWATSSKGTLEGSTGVQLVAGDDKWRGARINLGASSSAAWAGRATDGRTGGGMGLGAIFPNFAPARPLGAAGRQEREMI